MKTLVVEDDFTSRLLLQEVLKLYGIVDLAVDGQEAVTAFKEALEKGEPYRLVCLDIMMPVKDGQEALREMREMEEAAGISSAQGAKIIMTTALSDPRNVMASFYGLCDAYIIKPVEKAALMAELNRMGLIC